MQDGDAEVAVLDEGWTQVTQGEREGEAAYLVDIGMPDFGQELERRRTVRVVLRELEAAL